MCMEPHRLAVQGQRELAVRLQAQKAIVSSGLKDAEPKRLARSSADALGSSMPN